jgi:hypothetical protein
VKQRFFNTAGPCDPERHFMVPPLERAPEARGLIEQDQYFVVHAPRQSGKTTFLRALAKDLMASGEVVALHFTCEVGEVAGEDVAWAQDSVLRAIRTSAQVDLPLAWHPPELELEGGQLKEALGLTLAAWSQKLDRRLVLFFDEIDALQGNSLRSVLRQLRAGYNNRGVGRFPTSVALCGLRDVRDYKAASGGDPQRLGTSSPFNVSVESIQFANFDAPTVASLYGQYTAQTGQPFTPVALERAHALSGGQPWLVNALAREVVQKIQVPLDQPIEPMHLDLAKERLILARQTHLDSLVARLNEPRVRRVIAPLLAGDVPEMDSTYNDDVAYVRDLGLIAPKPPLAPANPIYREVMLRVLAAQPFETLQVPVRSFVRADRSLDMRAVMEEFAAFWREQGELFSRTVAYHEAACELVLSAWLQRIINGGGHIERQYGIALRRMDVLIRWPPGGNLLAPMHLWQREALELKVWRDGEPDPLKKGLQQIESYLHSLGLERGWLVLFDRRSTRATEEERTVITTATTPARGYTVDLLRA